MDHSPAIGCARVHACVLGGGERESLIPGTDFPLRFQQAFLYHWGAMAPRFTGPVSIFLDIEEDDSKNDLALLSPS